MYINSINNVSLKGRADVIDALTHAAQCSKAIERMNQCIYTVNRNMFNAQIASRDEYLEKACSDDEFFNALKTLSPAERKKLNSLLKGARTARSGYIQPIINFEDALKKAYIQFLLKTGQEYYPK